MPVTTAYAPISYDGDGLTTVFTITFPYQLQTDIVATRTVIATGITTPLTLGSDYSITPTLNSPASTGSLVMVTPPTSAQRLTIARAVPLTQLTSWVPNDPNLSTSTMNAVDKLTMALQDNAANSLNPGGDASTFVRGDGVLSNTLVGGLGAFNTPSDTQTLLTAGQTAASAIRVVSGQHAQGSFRFGTDASANSWDMAWVHDPDLAAIGWQAYGGALLGVFGADGNVTFDGNLTVAGTTNSTLYTGAADASLITTGTIDTARLGSGTANANTYLRGDQTWQLITGGGGGINTTTTGTFTIAAVGLTQTVPVTATTGIVVGSQIQIGDGTHIINGHVTAIASLNLTVETDAVAAGTAGDTMASGAAVQSSAFPGTNGILIGDQSGPQFSSYGFSLTGTGNDVVPPLSNTNFFGNVKVYVAANNGGNPLLGAYLAGHIKQSSVAAITDGGGAIAGVIGIANSSATASSLLAPSADDQVLIGNSTGARTTGFGFIGPANITAASLTPALLNLTNALTDTYLFSYDSASGHFKMVAPSSALPGGGTTAKFLRGDTTWSSAIEGPIDVDLSSATTLRIGVANIFGGSTPVQAYLQPIASGSPVADTPLQIHAQTAIGGSQYNTMDTTSTVEYLQVGGLARATALRDTYGPLHLIYEITGPTNPQTIDLVNGAYQRISSIGQDFTIALADTTPLPTAARFATELTLEINAPGAFTITWPGTITWANGVSAPTLSTTGINVIRLTRRQGQTQWIGSVDNPAGTSTYTDAQARSAVLSNTYLLDSPTIAQNVVAGTSTQPAVIAGSIGNTQLASGIQISKLQGYPGNAAVFLNGAGGWTTPPGGGGGFSPATSYSWTAKQILNATLTGTSTQKVTIAPTTGADSNISIIQPDASYALQTQALAVHTLNQNPATTSQNVIGQSLWQTVINPGCGGLNWTNWYDLRGSCDNTNSPTFGAFHAAANNIISTRQMDKTGTGGTNDSTWLVSSSPNSQFSATPDSDGIVHSFTGGQVRIGEVNYGNAWADFGLYEIRQPANTKLVCGMEFFPQYVNGPVFSGSLTNNAYNAQYAISIGFAQPGADNFFPQNWMGLLVDQNAISPGGYGLRLWGSNGTFNTRIGGIGASAATNAPAAIIKISGTAQTGIDFAGTAHDTTVLTATNTGNPAITMADDQSIKLGSIWLRGHSGALQYSTDGSAWTNVTLP